MSDEISFRFSFEATKGTLAYPFDSGELLFDMAGDRQSRITQTIGFAAAEALNLGDLAAGECGLTMFRNNSAANFVELSMNSDGSDPFAKLSPAKAALIPLASGAIYAKA